MEICYQCGWNILSIIEDVMISGAIGLGAGAVSYFLHTRLKAYKDKGRQWALKRAIVIFLTMIVIPIVITVLYGIANSGYPR